jgi:hypothetical protein
MRKPEMVSHEIDAVGRRRGRAKLYVDAENMGRARDE